jgi:cytoskeleton protein RodZ
MSLRQIATTTKISSGFLEAIERDDLNRLPGGIITRAFVRAYAAELGVDPERTLHDFLAQFPDGVAESHVAQPDVPVEPEAVGRGSLRTVLHLGLLTIPLGLGILWLAFRPPDESGAQERPRLAAERIVALRPEIPPPGPLQPIADMIPSPDEALPAVLGSDDLTIVLATDRACWIAAAADGQPVVARLVAAGDRTVLRGAREVTFKVGDAGAVRLQVNGEIGRSLGGPGQVVTARIDQANFRRYLEQP